MNIFEQASPLGLRFDTIKGPLTIEDLWRLQLTSRAGRLNLDDIAIGLDAEVKASAGTTSFVDTSVGADPIPKLKFDIVIHIIKAIQVDNALKLQTKDRAEKKQLILAKMDELKTKEMDNKTMEELETLYASL